MSRSQTRRLTFFCMLQAIVAQNLWFQFAFLDSVGLVRKAYATHARFTVGHVYNFVTMPIYATDSATDSHHTTRAAIICPSATRLPANVPDCRRRRQPDFRQRSFFVQGSKLMSKVLARSNCKHVKRQAHFDQCIDISPCCSRVSRRFRIGLERTVPTSMSVKYDRTVVSPLTLVSQVAASHRKWYRVASAYRADCW